MIEDRKLWRIVRNIDNISMEEMNQILASNGYTGVVGLKVNQMEVVILATDGQISRLKETGFNIYEEYDKSSPKYLDILQTCLLLEIEYRMKEITADYTEKLRLIGQGRQWLSWLKKIWPARK